MLDLTLYLVTDAALCGERGVAQTVAKAVDGGATAVQLRDKHASDADIVAQLRELADVIAGRALLLVNDRLDAAVAAREQGIRVDGVHLGQGDVAVECARELLGPDAIIGLTANTPEQLAVVAALPAGTVDYLGVGVIRPTSTKPDHPPALGIDGFAALAASTPLPCVAIGGVRLGDVALLRGIGAAGIAVVSALCAAPDVRAAAAAFVDAWSGRHIPRVLSIAGSDPSGGAGIQADLKSIAANGGYGMAAITALTAQNTLGVTGVHVPPAAVLAEQLAAIDSDIAVDAVKLGMLANAEIIDTVASWLAQAQVPLVVLDPVMVATSGDRLLDSDAEEGIRGLLAHASLVTPNVPELAVLTGMEPARSWAEVLTQAITLSRDCNVRVFAKGGHLGGADCPDALVDGTRVIEFGGDRIATRNTHGTGCSLSAALATRIARSGDWQTGAAAARAWLRESLRASDQLQVGAGHGPVHHFAGLYARGGIDTAPSAAEIREQWWDALADVRATIDELPFIRALADGTLAQPVFLRYIAQDAIYLGEYARVLAHAATLAPDSAARAFWARSVDGAIVGELELHAERLAASGTRGGEADATTTAYLDHLLATAARGSYEELIAAVLPCFWLYTDLGERLHAGAFGDYARSTEHPYASWLATYADASFADATRKAIDIVAEAAAAADADMRQRMWRAFRIAAEYEVAFFAAPMLSERSLLP